jgi:hypothetical protein
MLLAIQGARPVALDEKENPLGPSPIESPKHPAPAPAVKQPHDSVLPPHLVQDANGKKGIAEPRAFSGLGDPTKPPRMPAPRKLPGAGANPPDLPGPTGLIPDSRLRDPPRAPGIRLMSSPTRSDAVAERRILSRIAEYSRDRALPLAVPIEAALSEGKENIAPATAAEPDASDRIRGSVPWAPPLVVREYASPPPGRSPGQSLSADTILWQPVIVLPTEGKATVTFHTGSAPGGYQVIVAGHTLDGRIGSFRMILPVRADPTPAPPSSK